MFSLDALRGLDMLFLCVVQPIVMVCARSWGFADESVHPFMRQMAHHWGGFTAYDLIMPLFIFMCGAAIPLALPKRIDAEGRPTAAFWRHVASRFVLLWVLGMVCQGRLLSCDPSQFVWYSNTLQSIAVGYVIAALVFLVSNRAVQVALPFVLAGVYGALLHLSGDYSPAGNLAMRVDMFFVRMIQPCGHDTGEYTWYLTSLMFGAMTLCGMESTRILQSVRSAWRKAGLLTVLGAGLWAAGLLLKFFGVPCIKQIFTVSFTAQAMGASVLLLVALYVVTDIWKFRRGWWIVMLYGQSALAAYVLGIILRPIPTAAAQKVFGGLAARIGGSWGPVVLQVGFAIALTFFLWLWKRANLRRTTGGVESGIGGRCVGCWMIAVIAFTGVACTSEHCDGCASAAKLSQTTFAKESFQKYVDSGEIPGVIAVFHKDGLEEVSCLGYANVEERRPMAMDAIFQQCSQTKGFCGVTAAILVEEGRLNLDDPISKYLPEYAEIWVETKNTNGVRRLEPARHALTVRMCLTHTGGLPFEVPNYRAMGGWSRRMPLRSAAAVGAGLPFLFDPGTGERYSNLGIDVAAAVVEVVSGMRWEDFLMQRVLLPLGMNDSGFKPTDEQLSRRIDIYTVRKGRRAVRVDEMPAMRGPYNDDRVFASSGAGLWTTARDQLKFYKMLMNLGAGENGVRILKEETVKRLLAVSQRPKGLGENGYSLGLTAPYEDGEDQWFGHGGAWASQGLVNWHRKELCLFVVQFDGGYEYRDDCTAAANRFFEHAVGDSDVNVYTGRVN